MSNDGFSEMAMVARELLEQVAQFIDPTCSAEVEEEDEEIVRLVIRGDGSGILIGRRGATLDAIQYLVNLMVQNRNWEQRKSIGVDAEGYRQRRREQMEALARETAQDVRDSGRPMTLQNLSPADRRVVHIVLREEPDLHTESHGEGKDRVLTVSLNKKD